jgi:hypothetical protein
MESKSTKINSTKAMWWAISILVLVFLLFVVLLLISVDYQFSKILAGDEPDVSDPNTARQKLDEFTKITKIQFTPTTRLLNYKSVQWLDRHTRLKIEMSREDLQGFINSHPLAEIKLLSEKEKPYIGMTESGPDWWEVKSVKKWKAGRTELSPNACLIILVDLDHQSKVIIYLEYFTG